jgi:hypothetical protein
MNEVGNTARRRKRVGLGSKLLFGLLGLLGLAGVLTVGTLLFGLHSGEEFAPNNFARRSFYYFEIPLLGFQVSPIIRDDTTDSFARYLRNNFLKSESAGVPRWDLVRAARSGKVYFRGDAEILCLYLDASDENEASYWKAWSENNKEAAKALWPLVARLAKRQLYILAPELIDRARSEVDPEQLQRELNEILARQFLRLGRTEQEVEHHETAIDLLDEALTYAPGDPEITRCRNVSRRALGQTVEADLN